MDNIRSDLGIPNKRYYQEEKIEVVWSCDTRRQCQLCQPFIQEQFYSQKTQRTTTKAIEWPNKRGTILPLLLTAGRPTKDWTKWRSCLNTNKRGDYTTTTTANSRKTEQNGGLLCRYMCKEPLGSSANDNKYKNDLGCKEQKIYLK